MDRPYSIAIHGGAGLILREHMSPEREAACRKGLREALQHGYEMLASGAHALDAAETSVRILEDNPLFNAGRGAVFAGDGSHRLDASLMRGDTLQAGAVADVRGVRNPISLARRVMEASAYVMMAGSGAEDFARAQGLPFEPPEYFFDPLRYEQWLSVRDSYATLLDHADKGEKNFSTVGAVACDRRGNLAAATSTGGMTNKRFGRIGDSPLIGAGTYAENETCAVSCTGHGEWFIRKAVAFDISRQMAYRGLGLAEACREVILGKLRPLGGEGGVIAVDGAGNVELAFNTAGMYRASWRSGGSPFVALYGDEAG